MTESLPEKPLSRKESYLAKIAGEDVVIPEAPESRTEQYLAYIAENGGGGGGTTYTAGDGITIAHGEISVTAPNEYVELTPTGVGTGTITVATSKTPSEVKALLDAGKDVVYRIVIPQQVGTFSAGTYLLRTVASMSTAVAACATFGNGSFIQEFIFLQESNTNTGTIYVIDLATKAYVDTLVGNIESALNAINNGGNNR